MTKSEIVRGYMDRFPSLSNHAISRMVYKENHAMFHTVESVRSVARYIRGSSGAENRQKISPVLKKYFHRELPKSLDDGKNWGPFTVSGKSLSAIISDIHLPYHDDSVMETVTTQMRKMKVDNIILNGDTMDFYGVSHWERDPRRVDFKAEIECGRHFLSYLRGTFPKSRIIFKVGNHEDRLERYLIQKAPELLGINTVGLAELLKFDDFGVEIVKDCRPILLGKLNVLHGHEYKFNISNPVNPARGLFMRAKTLALCGHFHQSSSHSEKDLDQKVITCFSTGCCCQMSPAYRPINNWNHGFAMCEVDKDDAFNVHNYRIFGGKLFE